jgi:hypothetical protein
LRAVAFGVAVTVYCTTRLRHDVVIMVLRMMVTTTINLDQTTAAAAAAAAAANAIRHSRMRKLLSFFLSFFLSAALWQLSMTGI